MQRIAIISDTHGTYDERVDQLFTGSTHIIHAGDIGLKAAHLIDHLSLIAPVTVVTGNIDWNTPLDMLYPMQARLEVAGVDLFVQHIGGKPTEYWNALPQPLPRVAICGHSHIPLIETYRDVLFINPGSASQPRFGREPTVAFLDVEDNALKAEIIPLEMTRWL